MKIASIVARLLLGLIFVVFGLNFFLQFIHQPPPVADSAADYFLRATYPTGYLKFVHVLEVVGGVLLLVGRFQNLALTLLGPIIVNILLYHFLVFNGSYPLPVALAVLALIVLAGRRDYVRAVFAP